MKQSAGMRRPRFRPERHATQEQLAGGRAATLRQVGVDLVYLAATACDMPIAYLSCIEGRHHRIMAATGAPVSHPHLHAEQCLQLVSSGQDLPFVETCLPGQENRLGLPEGVALFAGVPIQGQGGELLGSLCLMDYRAREMSEQQKNMLLSLARQAAAHIEANNHLNYMQERVQCFETCLDSSPAILTIKDEKGAYRYANAAFLELVGRSLAEVVGKTDDELWSPDMAARLLEKDRRARHAGTSYSEAELVSRPDGICRYWQMHRFTMKGSSALLASVGFDITDWKANEQQLMASQELLKRSLENLEVLSVTDGLTGLHNRRAFEERLKEEFERARRYNLPLSLLMLDADRFKEFNDACGHPAGDHLLKELALVLKRNARANDIVARYGGDEFAVILPNTDSKVAFHLAERLRRAAKAVCHPDQPVSVSVGVSALKATMLEPHSLLVAADKALYDAKRKGRNRVSQTAGMQL